MPRAGSQPRRTACPGRGRPARPAAYRGRTGSRPRSAGAGRPARPPRRVNPADRPWLDVDGERYPLMGAMTVLGRDDSADIILDDPGISRRHSEIRVTNDGPHLVRSIRDLGSTNGTFVNSERITSSPVTTGTGSRWGAPPSSTAPGGGDGTHE